MLSSIFDSVFEMISAPALEPPLKSTSYFWNSPEFDRFFSEPAVIAALISPSTAVMFLALLGVGWARVWPWEGCPGC
jgi:hypothetical protein